jgi:hypothetical protein
MSQYLLLLHEKPERLPHLSPDEIQRITGEYVAWTQQLAMAGKLVHANKLRDEGGRHIRKSTVTDGPYVEGKEVVAGYYVIEAPDYDAAVALGRGCPHTKYGGWIEVREIEPMNVPANA